MADQTQQHKTGIRLSSYVRYMVADYAPLGKSYTLTIKWVTEAEWYNKKSRQSEKCACLVFEETPAQLKLTSHENCRTLARLWGADADNWIGKVIVIRAEELAMGDGEGGKKRTIRIVGEGRKVKPAPAPTDTAKPTTAAPTTLDELMAYAAEHGISDETVQPELARWSAAATHCEKP